MSLTLSDLWSFRWQYSLIVVVSELIAVCMLGLVKSFELSCLLHPVFVFHSVSPKLQMHTLHDRFYMVDVALHDIFYNGGCGRSWCPFGYFDLNHFSFSGHLFNIYCVFVFCENMKLFGPTKWSSYETSFVRVSVCPEFFSRNFLTFCIS